MNGNGGDWKYDQLYPEVKRGWRFWLVALSAIPLGLGLFFAGRFALEESGGAGRAVMAIAIVAFAVGAAIFASKGARRD